jgi:hypothetical protein
MSCVAYDERIRYIVDQAKVKGATSTLELLVGYSMGEGRNDSKRYCIDICSYIKECQPGKTIYLLEYLKNREGIDG